MGVTLLLLFMAGSRHASGQEKKDSVFPKVDSMKPVVVRPKSIRPRWRGDTVEYNTESVLLRRFANVEQLLGRLPGLQIDADGNVIYNGEKIQRLLVDGKDIFGGDPRLITKNLDASKIARVQLLERKSDHANFTGIDDGTRTKTLNLILKEDARNSGSGKIEAGANANGNYDAKGFLASFRGKEQLVGLGVLTNTGGTGYGGAPGATIYLVNKNNDPLGAIAGVGIPHSTAGVLHYANGWNDGQSQLKSNYKITRYYTQPTAVTQSLQILPAQSLRVVQQSNSTNQQDEQYLSGTYDFSPDNRNLFQLSLIGKKGNGRNLLAAMGTSAFNDTLVNANQRNISDQIVWSEFSAFTSWKRTIGKDKSRAFAATIGMQGSDNKTEGYIYSLSRYYQPNGNPANTDTVDQRKRVDSRSRTIGGDLSYTQPLWNSAVLGLDYKLSITANKLFQGSFDRGDGKYTDMRDSLSNDITSHMFSQSFFVSIQGKGDKLSYSLTNSWIGNGYRQNDRIEGSYSNLHYLNWAPDVSIRYTASASSNFILSYSASTDQPPASQILPVKNNTDPLHIVIGNPTLRPTRNNDISVGFDQLKDNIIHLSLSVALQSNTISTKTTTDSLGRQVSQAVNVDGGRNINMYFSVGKRVLGLETTILALGSFARTVNYVNAELSNNDSYNATEGLSIRKSMPGKYSLGLSSSLGYVDLVSSINESVPVHYWTQNYSADLTFFLGNYELGTNANYSWQQSASSLAQSISITRWNAHLTRSFFSNKLSLRLELNDILDQSTGIGRTITGNTTSQSQTNTLGRYYMLSAVYHFDKAFKKK